MLTPLFLGYIRFQRPTFLAVVRKTPYFRLLFLLNKAVKVHHFIVILQQNDNWHSITHISYGINSKKQFCLVLVLFFIGPI